MLRILALKSKDEQDNVSLVGGRSLCGVHSEEEKERGFVEEKGGRSIQGTVTSNLTSISISTVITVVEEYRITYESIVSI